MFSWKRIRYGIMFGFLAFITWVGYQHQSLGGGPAGIPTVDSLCPLGGLESIYSYITSGVWLRRTAPSSLILFVAVAVMTLLVGRVFCGWICPLGSIGEFSNIAARKLGIKRRELPASADRWLKMLKYVVLALILYFTWMLGTLAWRPYDPWVSWMHLSSGWEEIVSSPWGYIVLFFVVIGAGLFIERFWCRYLCPLGAALAVFQKFSATKIVRSKESCISCSKCDRSCPMGVTPMALEKVTDADCISCGRCTESCPVEKTLEFSFAGKKVLSALMVGVIGVGLYFAAYGTAKVTGYWQTFASTSIEALRDPVEGIFGWMNIEQVANQVKLTPAKVLEIAGLPADAPLDVSVKQMEGISDDELKDRLKAYFAENPAKAPEPTRYVVPHNPDELKGSVTIAQIAEGYGLTTDAILEKAGLPFDTQVNILMRDAARAAGLDPTDIREAVKALIQERSN